MSHLDTEMHHCRQCGENKPMSAFSQSQLAKGQKARCTSCLEGFGHDTRARNISPAPPEGENFLDEAPDTVLSIVGDHVVRNTTKGDPVVTFQERWEGSIQWSEPDATDRNVVRGIITWTTHGAANYANDETLDMKVVKEVVRIRADWDGRHYKVHFENS